MVVGRKGRAGSVYGGETGRYGRGITVGGMGFSNGGLGGGGIF